MEMSRRREKSFAKCSERFQSKRLGQCKGGENLVPPEFEGFDDLLSGQQFVRIERFDQVIVRARSQPVDAVRNLGLGGEHQDKEGDDQPPFDEG